MKIPKTTEQEPYIEFRINDKGKMRLSATSGWWGGKNHYFISTDGTRGNTCKPKDLDAYIKAFKNREVRSIKKQIKELENRLKILLK